MSLDIKKLENVQQHGTKVIARCPACAQDGADTTGEHLVVYPDGKFGCVAYPKDKEHNKAIMRLAGVRGLSHPPPFQIRRAVVKEITTIMVIGQVGRVKPTPIGEAVKDVPPTTVVPPIPGPSGRGNPSPCENGCKQNGHDDALLIPEDNIQNLQGVEKGGPRRPRSTPKAKKPTVIDEAAGHAVLAAMAISREQAVELLARK